MKIGSKPDTPLVSSDIAARANVRSSTTSAIPAVAGIAAIDQATVSAAGTAISQQAGSADFDSAKVDSIRQAIREGRFSVNPEAIADRLIADAAIARGGCLVESDIGVLDATLQARWSRAATTAARPMHAPPTRCAPRWRACCRRG